MNPIASDAIHAANKALSDAGLPTYEQARECLAAFLSLCSSEEAEIMQLGPRMVAALKEAERITSA